MLVVSEVCAIRYHAGDVGGSSESSETGAVGRSASGAAVGVAEAIDILAIDQAYCPPLLHRLFSVSDHALGSSALQCADAIFGAP